MTRHARMLALLLVAAAALVVLAGFTRGSSQGGSPLQALQDAYRSVVKKVSPSVVQIETGSGLGSGVVFDAKGDIVTNAHVVGSARTFTVTLSDGSRRSGTLVGTFVPDDLAVIRVTARGLRPARFADSSKVRVGDIVMAVGNPLGFRSSVTDGIVSALGRTVSEPNGAALPNVIQTSAPINPGNSGGALVDLNGAVVGIPTLAAIDSGLGSQAPGIGFAIPSNTVKMIASQLVANGHVVSSGRAYLGVRLATLTNGGVLVQQVVAGGPAAKAGVRAGDVILAVNGKPTPTGDDLAAVLATLKPGDAAKLSLRRPDGSRASVTVTLGEYPGS